MVFVCIPLWFLILNLCQTFVADPSFTLPTFGYPLSAYDCCWLQLRTSAWPQFCLLTWYYTACTLPTSTCSCYCFCLKLCVLLFICYQPWPVTWLPLNLNLVFPLCNTSCIPAHLIPAPSAPLTSSGTQTLVPSHHPCRMCLNSYICLDGECARGHLILFGSSYRYLAGDAMQPVAYGRSGHNIHWSYRQKIRNTEPLLRSGFSIVLYVL